MGASDFMTIGKGETAKSAFHKAVSQAQYDYGHAGYTGSIAEKDSFIIIPEKEVQNSGMTPENYAWHLIEIADFRVNDKWGPAGCIKIKDGVFLFFGWASS